MYEIAKFLTDLRENKPFLCIVVFVSYTLGLITFYSNTGVIIPLLFSLVILSILIFLSFETVFSKFIPKLFILILYLLFLFGFINAKAHFTYSDDFQNIIFAKNAEIKGIVQGIPKCSYNKGICKVKVDVKSAKLEGIDYKIHNAKVLINYKDDKRILVKHFDTIKLKGVLNSPNNASNPSQFDYKNFLNNKGILKLFYGENNTPVIIKSPKLSDIKEYSNLKDKVNFFFGFFTRKMNDIKDETILKHSKHIKSPRLEILGGVVFGDDAVNPPDEVKNSFVNSGLLHLLAASGLNVALILSMWFCMIYFIKINYKIKVLSGILIVLLYTFMTGFPPSIVRASVMLILILSGKLMYREANGVSLIFTAGSLILLFRPEFLVDVGFQLSFLVTLGLIICTPCVTELFKNHEDNFKKKYEKYPNIIKSALLIFSPVSIVCIFLIPLIAQLWAAPLQAYYFNTFSTYSLFANIAVVPFIGIVSFLGFISTAFCLVPHLDKFLYITDPILNFVIQIVYSISNYFAGLRSSLIVTPSPEISALIFYYSAVILFFISLKYLFKRRFLNFSFLICFILLILFSIKLPNKNFEIIFFNVGNADNALIKTPDNDYIMIDTGRTIRKGFSTASTITLEYLYDNNIKTLDSLIVTHYDSDHSGGLVDILEKIKVNKLIIDKPICTSINSCEIKKYIENNNIKYIKPYNNQVFYNKNGVKMTNYVPQSDNILSKNDSSTITLVEYSGLKFLFMADVSINALPSVEKYLPYDVSVLKASHHGAKYTVDDKTLLKLKPHYTVISTGKNPYGHPNILTVSKLNKYSKNTVSTKEYGAIKFVVDNKGELKGYYYYNGKRKFTPF